jgi:hypothetical protein
LSYNEREALEKLARVSANRVFEPAALTEDYESGLRLHRLGCRQVFVPITRLGKEGRDFMAVREFFPKRWGTALRQRTRWVTGIALQGWERFGWAGTCSEVYWFWRDRKGLVSNPLGFIANAVFVYGVATQMWNRLTPLAIELTSITLAFQILRMAVRMSCVARVYGTVFALGVPVVIALNKVDRLKPGHIAEQMQNGARLGAFHSLHPVSALTGDGVGELRDDLVELLPEGPAYYPAGQRSDVTPELHVAELIREKALHLTREEVPHAISVEVDELGEKVVRATIFVETDSQKQIVVGKGGSIVKKIGTRARPEIEQLLGRTVFLELNVKARPRWRRDEAMLERLGL